MLIPITFIKVVSGIKKTFSAITTSFTFNKDVAGNKTTFSQLTIPVIFSKDVSGQRKTFSQIVRPFIFSKEVIGQHGTFGQIDFRSYLSEKFLVKYILTDVTFPIIATIDVVAEVQGIRYGQASMSLDFR